MGFTTRVGLGAGSGIPIGDIGRIGSPACAGDAARCTGCATFAGIARYEGCFVGEAGGLASPGRARGL